MIWHSSGKTDSGMIGQFGSEIPNVDFQFYEKSRSYGVLLFALGRKECME